MKLHAIIGLHDFWLYHSYYQRYVTVFTKIQLVGIHDTIASSHMIYYNSFFIFLYVIPVCHVIT